MPSFSVYMHSGISANVKVEAEDFDEAVELAYQETPTVDLVGNEFEQDGDWIALTAENEDTHEEEKYPTILDEVMERNQKMKALLDHISETINEPKFQSHKTDLLALVKIRLEKGMAAL